MRALEREREREREMGGGGDIGRTLGLILSVSCKLHRLRDSRYICTYMYIYIVYIHTYNLSHASLAFFPSVVAKAKTKKVSYFE